MSDNELDVPQSQGESSGADGHVDLSGTAVATAAHDGEELEPNKDGRNGHRAVGYRAELHLAENIVNPETWAGGMEDKRAIAPRLRVGRDKWFNLLWLIPVGFAVLVAAVAVGKGLHNMPAVQAFIQRSQRYPGTHVPSGVSPGIPAWAGWTHFFNLFLMMVHHPLRASDPLRSSAALLQSQRHARQGRVAPGGQAGARRPAVDGQGRFGCATRSVGVARDSPFHWTGSVVAPRR